jgi:hypothetical protein
MTESAVSSSRWPVWLLAFSVVLGIPLVYNTLFGVAIMPHSSEAIAVLLAVLAGAAVLGISAVIGIVVLIARPAQRTFIGYFAVVLALVVGSLVFAPSGLLR